MNRRSPHLENARLSRMRPALELRDRILFGIRSWFHAGSFLEIETPVRIPAPALERHIDAEPSGAAYLRTSPELHMKRLLCAGYQRIFQIGPCFRKNERGPIHHPEYTMLEWYRTPADYIDILSDTQNLFQSLIPLLPERSPLSPTALRPPWPRWTVSNAFREFAGWDPVADYDADRFERDLVERVEPALPRDRPVVLTDYPAPAAALARIKPSHPAVAERWELYLRGVEIANAFSELTDASEQRHRFNECAAERRAAGCTVYALDEPFLAALTTGLPPSGGIALGIDRLIMVLLGATSLDGVIAFREDFSAIVN